MSFSSLNTEEKRQVVLQLSKKCMVVMMMGDALSLWLMSVRSFVRPSVGLNAFWLSLFILNGLRPMTSKIIMMMMRSVCLVPFFDLAFQSFVTFHLERAFNKQLKNELWAPCRFSMLNELCWHRYCKQGPYIRGIHSFVYVVCISIPLPAFCAEQCSGPPLRLPLWWNCVFL